MNGSPETPLRAFIVDDERLARENLRDLLREHPRIRVVGEARNVDEARRGIDERRPDLLFLDIQMPGGSGFDLIEGLEAPVDHLRDGVRPVRHPGFRSQCPGLSSETR